jgi:Tol biopolymer transport system component
MKMRICAFVVLAAAALLEATAARSTPETAKASQRAGKIAFIRLVSGPGNGPQQLFVVRPDGSGLRALTPLSRRVQAYAWSPDGRLIAYIDQRLSLWLIRPDGTGRRLLLSSFSKKLSSENLSWSPNGREIAVASPGPDANPRNQCTTIYIVPISGARPTALPVRSTGCNIAWSPRGNEIAYDRFGLSVVRPDGTGRRRIPHAGGGAQWSANGRQLVFGHHLRYRPGGFYAAFAVVDADGMHFHVVTTHAYTEYPVAWSPHGHRILYGRANRKGIYVVDANGRNDRRVTTDSPPEALWGALGWSPDGRSIVYATDRTGNGDLYVIGAGGRDKVQITSTSETDVDPSWAAG